MPTFEEAVEILSEDFYLPVDQTHTQYSTHKKSPFSLMDINKRVAQHPAYWKTRKRLPTGRIKKNIILNGFPSKLIRNSDQSNSSALEQVKNLLKNGFSVFIPISNGELIPVTLDSIEKKEAFIWRLVHLKPLSQPEFRKILIHQGLNPEEYVSLNDHLVQKINATQQDNKENFNYNIDINVEMAEDLLFWEEFTQYISIKKLKRINLISQNMITDHRKIYAILDRIQKINENNLQCLSLKKCKLHNLPDLSRYSDITQLILLELDLVDPGLLPQAIKELILGDIKESIQYEELNLSCLKQLDTLTLINTSAVQFILPQTIKKVFIQNSAFFPNLSSYSNLTEITLSNLGIEAISAGTLPINIKKLSIQFCRSLKNLPDLSVYKDLTTIEIKNSGIESIDRLPLKIKQLNLTLKQLPDLSAYKNLTAIKLDQSDIESIKELPANIQKLDLSFCHSLKTLPDLSVYKNLTAIKLYQSGLEFIKELPVNIQELDLSFCHSLKTLSDLSAYKNLTVLSLYESGIKSIEELPPNIQALKLLFCPSLKKLPDLSTYQYLKDIKLPPNIDNDILTKLPKNIEKLYLQYNTLSELPDLSVYKNLTHLDLSDSQIKTFKDLSPNIENLELCGCKFLKNLPNLSGYINLKSILFMHSGIETVEGLPPNLAVLNLYLCTAFKQLPDLSDHKNLAIINLNNTAIETLKKLPLNIQTLSIKDCTSLKSFPDLSGYLNLKNLSVESTNLKNMDSLPRNLEHLDISDCKNLLTTTLDFSRFQNLISLKIDSGQKYVRLPKDVYVEKNVEDENSDDDEEEEKSKNTSSIDDRTFTPSDEKSEISIGMWTFNQEKKLITFPHTEIRQQVLEDDKSKIHHFISGDDLKIQFVSHFSADNIKNFQSDDGLCQFKLCPSTKWQSLPIRYTNDAIVSLSAPLGKEIRYNTHLQQYEIRWPKDAVSTQPVTIQYRLRPRKEMPEDKDALNISLQEADRDFISKIIAEKKKPAKAKPSPKFHEFYKKLNTFATTTPHPNLAQVQAFCETTLAKYCEDFDNEHLSDESKTLPNWQRILFETKGACRHRVEIFYKIARYLGLSVRKVENETHVFIEIYDAAKKTWKRIDLGGAPVKIIDRRPSFQFAKSKRNFKPKDLKKTDTGDLWQPVFPIATLKPYRNLNAVLSDILSVKENVLIPLNSMQQARDVYAALVPHEHKPILYIESVADLIASWTTHRIENGQLRYFPGPLQIMNHEGKGHVVINWARFKPEEITAFQSMLDISPTQPTFKGYLLSPGLHIVNLITPETPECESFYSRPTMFPWPKNIDIPKHSDLSNTAAAPASSIHDEKTPKKFPPVDLYGDPYAWQIKLIGDIQVAGKKYIFKPGKLVEAIRANQSPFILIDAPVNNPDFQYFMTCLTTQKGLMVNGEWLRLPKDFKIEFQAAPPVTPPKEIKSIPPNEWPTTEKDHTQVLRQSSGQVFHLNMHTLPFLLQRLRFHKGACYTEDGWLMQFSHVPKCIVQTGDLTDGELRQVYDEICAVEHRYMKTPYPILWVDVSKNKPNPSPDAKAFLPAAWVSKEKKQTGVQLLEVDDPTFVVNQLPISFDTAIPIHTHTSGLDILENIEELKSSGQENNTFKVEVQKVARMLRDGKTVVLYGTLSEELYRALEGLFLPEPQLQLSEDKTPTPITGRLLIVSKPLDFSANLAYHTGRHANYAGQVNPWNVYEAQLKKEDRGFSKENLDKLRLFFQLAEKLPHGQVGFPPDLRITYQRIRQYLHLLNTQSHQDNPIKSCFLEDYHHPEARAYLNVLAKIIFCPPKRGVFVDAEKFKRLNDTNQPLRQSSGQTWQQLNCFNAAALRSLFFGRLDIDIQHPTHLAKIEKLLFDTPPLDLSKEISRAAKAYPAKFISKAKDAQEKTLKQINMHLQDHRGVFLQGPAGTGKTFIAKTYANQEGRRAFWDGNEKQILEWLNADKAHPDEEHVLIIDEANFKTPGDLEWLRPLLTLDAVNKKDEKLTTTKSSGQAYAVEFNQKPYNLSKRHKVIFTGNPGVYHDLLRDVPTLQVKPWTDKELLQKILVPLYQAHFNMASEKEMEEALPHLVTLLEIYRWVETHLPKGSLSIRDLESLAVRWLHSTTQDQSLSIEEKQTWFYHAAKKEWTYRFPDPKHKKAFLDHLQKTFPLADKNSLLRPSEKKLLARLPKDFYLTPQQKSVLLAMSEDIDLSQHLLHSQFFKMGCLIEGDSGFGKTELIRQLLLTKGFKICTPTELLSDTRLDFRNHFIQFTASENIEEDTALLRAAFMKGCIVLLDELNLSPELDTLLNHLMTGKTPENESPNYHGFRVMATQNSLLHAGRKKIKEGLFNRFHVFHITPHTREDLCYIAEQAFPHIQKPLAAGAVTAYLNMKTADPRRVNTRHFYKGLKCAKENLAFQTEIQKRQERQSIPTAIQDQKLVRDGKAVTTPLIEDKKHTPVVTAPLPEQKESATRKPIGSSARFFYNGQRYLARQREKRKALPQASTVRKKVKAPVPSGSR